MSIGSIQEGEEWIARLQKEADEITADIVTHMNTLTQSGINALRYHQEQTIRAIEEIQLEMMMYEE